MPNNRRYRAAPRDNCGGRSAEPPGIARSARGPTANEADNRIWRQIHGGARDGTKANDERATPIDSRKSLGSSPHRLVAEFSLRGDNQACCRGSICCSTIAHIARSKFERSRQVSGSCERKRKDPTSSIDRPLCANIARDEHASNLRPACVHAAMCLSACFQRRRRPKRSPCLERRAPTPSACD